MYGDRYCELGESFQVRETEVAGRIKTTQKKRKGQKQKEAGRSDCAEQSCCHAKL